MKSSLPFLLVTTSVLTSLCASAALVTSTADSGPGSLREVIANASVGETITFAVSNLITLTGGELAVATDLTITGPGSSNLTIERSHAEGTPAFRVFNITSGSVRISGLTLSNGLATAGGGINNEDRLIVAGCTISGNTATERGGGINNSGTLTLSDTTVISNTTAGVGGASASGGGINNNAGGTIQALSRCVVLGNSATGGAGGGDGLGGGIANDHGTIVNISETLISSNSATGDLTGGGLGGGIHNSIGSTVETLTNSVVSDNATQGGSAGGASSGGAIHNEGTLLQVIDSTIRDNVATGGSASGATGGASQGGGVASLGTVNLVNSTVSGNSATGGRSTGGTGGASRGGGIASECGTLTLETSTVSGNSAEGGAGPGGEGTAAGGGLFNDCGSATVNHSTVTANRAGEGPQQNGSGIFNSLGGTELKNSIVAGNSVGFDLFNEEPGLIGSGGFNLIGYTNAPISPGPNDLFNLSGGELKLGPLQDNGGPTFTHALYCGSPAIDAGDSTEAPEVDQRGFPRIVRGRMDIGAYEDNNTGPAVLCPKSTTLQAHSATGIVATLSVQVADGDGDGLVVVWAKEGAAVQTNVVASGGTSTFANVSFTASFGLGSHSVELRVIDSKQCEARCSTTVLVTSAPGQGCDLYPIALHERSLAGVAVGGVIRDIYNGVQPGNFGWLTWAGSPNEPTVVKSLTPPGDSATYTNPKDPSDHQVSVGDWVQGKPGISNSSQVRDALNTLTRIDITVPVWDKATGTGNNSLYRVVAFARVRLLNYRLPRENRITVRFLGLTNCQ